VLYTKKSAIAVAYNNRRCISDFLQPCGGELIIGYSFGGGLEGSAFDETAD
jgi:hypothetical protein